jgi:hypothetical protein
MGKPRKDTQNFHFKFPNLVTRPYIKLGNLVRLNLKISLHIYY